MDAIIPKTRDSRHGRWPTMAFARFTRFTLVGAVATSIQYIILMLLVDFLGVQPVLASSVGFVAGALGNYILNYHYTFQSTEQHGRPS